MEEKTQEYRGVILPSGMTPDCLDELARLFHEFESEDLKATEGDVAFPKDAAVIAFNIVVRHLRGKAPER